MADTGVERFADAVAELGRAPAWLSVFNDAMAQFKSGAFRPAPAAPPPGSPPPAPPATSQPLALQPLNVQMAELVGVVKAILLAVATGSGGHSSGTPERGPPAGLNPFAMLQGGMAGLQSASLLTNAAFSVLQQTMGAISGSITHFVGAFSPVNVRLFEREVRNLNGAIGEVMLPVLRAFSGAVKAVADGVASLSPAGRAAVAGLAAGTVALIALTAATVAFSVAANSALGGIPALLGLVAGTLTATLGGTALAMKGQAEVQRLVARVAAPATDAMNALGECLIAFAPVVEAVAVGVAEGLADGLKDVATVLGLLAPLLKELAPLFGIVAKAITATTFGLFRLLAGLTALLGLDTPSAYKPGSSEGKGFQNVTFGGVDEYLKRAQADAYGAANELQLKQEQNKQTGVLIDRVTTLNQTLLDHIRAVAKGAGVPGVGTASAVQDVAVDWVARRMMDIQQLR